MLLTLNKNYRRVNRGSHWENSAARVGLALVDYNDPEDIHEKMGFRLFRGVR